MVGETINPYAIYVYCDASMDYNSKNSGGIGFIIKFPDSVDMENIEIPIGKYERANIERLEMVAIYQGMNEILNIFEKYKSELRNVKTIIFRTDRLGLSDENNTNIFKIKDWRSRGWQNHEGKAIKNSDLLDKIDKTRKKINDKTFCKVFIKYVRSKYNRRADKLAGQGKKQAISKVDIALNGIKIGRRKFNNPEVDYNLLKKDTEYSIRIYMKQPVRDQWEISTELCEEPFMGMVLKIYSNDEIERRLHRHHTYNIRIKKIFSHHVIIYKTIKEIKNVEKQE